MDRETPRKFATTPGTRDVLPPESTRLLEVQGRIRERFRLFGFREVLTPALEYSEVIEEHGLRDVSYKLFDQDNQMLLLRPEMTTPIARLISQRLAGRLQKTFQNITRTDDLRNDLEHRRRMLSREIDTYTTEKRYVRKDFTLVWASLTVSLVRDTAGEPSYFISVVEDITGRKEAERTLRSLTPREVEVLRLLPRGHANREIARELNFSVSTVKNHVQHIITKLEVSDRMQAAARAVEIGLMDPER